jgi:hypothetical protein
MNPILPVADDEYSGTSSIDTEEDDTGLQSMSTTATTTAPPQPYSTIPPGETISNSALALFQPPTTLPISNLFQTTPTQLDLYDSALDHNVPKPNRSPMPS